MIYDNGTVTQQASANQVMAKKAQRFDELENKGRLQSAFSEGANVATAEADNVIQELAHRAGTLEGELEARDQRDSGLAGYAAQPQIKRMR